LFTLRGKFQLAVLAFALLVVVLIGVGRFTLMPAADTETTASPDPDHPIRVVSAGSANTRPAGESDTPKKAIRDAEAAEEARIAKRRALITASIERRRDNGPEQKDELRMPEWDRIILPGGMLRDDVDADGMFGSNGLPDFIDLYGGVEAEFIQENISYGVATDMSALLIGSRISDEVVYNGAVRAEHDLGNAYVLAAIGADNHLRLYAGVERLITEAGTYIEFEFNQNRIHLSSGAPWPLHGERSEGDLLVRMVFSDRVMQSMQLEQWQQGGYRFLDTGGGITGDNCRSTRQFMYCVGKPPIAHPPDDFEVWGEDDNLVETPGCLRR
jgi:hypothetical protein